MIKVVCFDLHETLAHYNPPREEVHARACREIGLQVDLDALRQSLPAADALWREENSFSPIDKRSLEEKMAVYARYESEVLKGAGVEISSDTALKIISKVGKAGLKFKAYDDALPTLGLLKQRHLILGLISNVGQELASICDDLGFTPYFDFKVSSLEVGCDKPHPGIFLAALERAGVEPPEALYIGDQYDLDVVGAQGVGIKAVLLDRRNCAAYDCPRISCLTEIVGYL
jgi:putative hydrolase of the HAD superfamily